MGICCNSHSVSEDFINDFWEGLAARKINPKKFVEKVLELYQKKISFSFEEWIITTNEFFKHTNSFYNPEDQEMKTFYECFFNSTYSPSKAILKVDDNKEKITPVYLVCSLIFIFKKDKKSALEAFTNAYTNLSVTKKTWIFEKDNVMAIDTKEFILIIEYYIRLVSLDSTIHFSKKEPEKNIGSLSKHYDNNILKNYIENIIFEGIDIENTKDYLRVNVIFDKYYDILCDSFILRDKLLEEFQKMYSKKTNIYKTPSTIPKLD